MKNNYRFVDEDNKTVHEANSTEKIILAKNQIVKVKNIDYSVFRVDQETNFDNWVNNITVYLNKFDL